MKKIIPFILLLFIFTGCRESIFIWTFKDVFGLIVLGIFALILGVWYVRESIKEWKRKRKRIRESKKVSL